MPLSCTRSSTHSFRSAQRNRCSSMPTLRVCSWWCGQDQAVIESRSHIDYCPTNRRAQIYFVPRRFVRAWRALSLVYLSRHVVCQSSSWRFIPSSNQSINAKSCGRPNFDKSALELLWYRAKERLEFQGLLPQLTQFRMSSGRTSIYTVHNYPFTCRAPFSTVRDYPLSVSFSVSFQTELLLSSSHPRTVRVLLMSLFYLRPGPRPSLVLKKLSSHYLVV